jgi:hypothetical protein
MSRSDPAEDAADCAKYLCSVRAEAKWDRFDAAVDDFLARHRYSLALSSLRRLLADAFRTCAPLDAEAHHRIRGRS